MSLFVIKQPLDLLFPNEKNLQWKVKAGLLVWQ